MRIRRRSEVLGNVVKKSRNIALGTLLVGLVGYAVGILTAPRSGRRTRREVHRRTVHAKLEAERKLKKLHSELGDLIKTGNSKVQKTKTKVRTELIEAIDGAKQAKEKARKVLSALHEGYAEDEDLDKAIKNIKKASNHLKRFVGSK